MTQGGVGRQQHYKFILALSLAYIVCYYDSIYNVIIIVAFISTNNILIV